MIYQAAGDGCCLQLERQTQVAGELRVLQCRSSNRAGKKTLKGHNGFDVLRVLLISGGTGKRS
jgi:hypothetical protein